MQNIGYETGYIKCAKKRKEMINYGLQKSKKDCRRNICHRYRMLEYGRRLGFVRREHFDPDDSRCH